MVTAKPVKDFLHQFIILELDKTLENLSWTSFLSPLGFGWDFGLSASDRWGFAAGLPPAK